jgi:hypothetical protein
MDYDPIASLEAVGYLEREASFLYLVAVHSGYFLRRQYCHFIERTRGGLANKFLQKATRLEHVKVLECGQSRHIYHLTSRPVYEALLEADSQNRRLKGDAHIQARLMVLDFVLDRLGAITLENEAAKIRFFAEQCHVSLQLLPQLYLGRLHFFPDAFPILLLEDGTPQFTFFEGGSVSTTRFERYLEQYKPLLSVLPGFGLTYLSDTEKSFGHATAAFHAHFPAARLLGVSAQTPLGVDHFLEFLRARERHETKVGTCSVRDLELLHEGEHIYSSLEHQALYGAWKIGSTNEDRIRHRFQLQGPKARFTTVVLPYSYPIFSVRRKQTVDGPHGSQERSEERSHVAKE